MGENASYTERPGAPRQSQQSRQRLDDLHKLEIGATARPLFLDQPISVRFPIRVDEVHHAPADPAQPPSQTIW